MHVNGPTVSVVEYWWSLSLQLVFYIHFCQHLGHGQIV
jgi:hypothetical protein